MQGFDSQNKQGSEPHTACWIWTSPMLAEALTLWKGQHREKRDVTVRSALWAQGSRLHTGTYYDSGVSLFCSAWARFYFLNCGLEKNERYRRLWLPCGCVRKRDNRGTWHRPHLLKVCSTASHHAIFTRLCSANGSSTAFAFWRSSLYLCPPKQHPANFLLQPLIRLYFLLLRLLSWLAASFLSSSLQVQCMPIPFQINISATQMCLKASQVTLPIPVSSSHFQ